MTKTQYYVAASLDGFIADAQGGIAWLTQFDGAEGISAHYEAFLEGVGALAMGAATYEFLLGAMQVWPYPGRATWVFTRRELPAFRGADLRFAAGDVGEAHEQMVRAAGGKNVWLVGGGKLAAQFAEQGLIDELWLGLAPVVLGAGAPLLPASLLGPHALEHVTRFGCGFVELRYAIAGGRRGAPAPGDRAG